MMPTIKSAWKKLSYPLYACDFDPNDPNKLVVGGGGGSSKTGVGNKITVLEVSDADKLAVAGEITLSADEDNVTTLAFGELLGKMTVIYAGVNSAPAEVEKGMNQHLRTLVAEPLSRATMAKLAEAAGDAPVSTLRLAQMARTSLFASRDKDAYQRLLRLPSPPITARTSMYGAVASAFASEPEIAIFETGSSVSGPGAMVRLRSRVSLTQEAVDLDIIQTADDAYQLAYCNSHDLFLLALAKTSSMSSSTPVLPESECVYSIPSSSNGRSSFRSIRYLTPQLLVAAVNLPRKQGVELKVFRLPRLAKSPAQSLRKQHGSSVSGQPTAEENEEEKPHADQAQVCVTHKLPRAISQATSLAVRNLNPPPTPSSSADETQFLVAVTGSDAAIYLLTLNQTIGSVSLGSREQLSNFASLATLKLPYHTHITSMAFSHFYPPSPASSASQLGTVVSPGSPMKPSFSRANPVVRLASVSMGQTAVVHTIPLHRKPDLPRPKGAKKVPSGLLRPQKYVVARTGLQQLMRSYNWHSIIVPALLALLISILLQRMLFGGDSADKTAAGPGMTMKKATPSSNRQPPRA